MRDSVPLGSPTGSKIMGSINLAVSTYDVRRKEGEQCDELGPANNTAIIAGRVS